MTHKKPILITGSHRSGTTWVGQMISLSPDICYLQEPFNPNNKFGLEFDEWFKYISVEEEYLYKDRIANLLALNYPIFEKLKLAQSFLYYRQHLGHYRRCLIHKIFNHKTLLKDPIAFFSADWLAQTFDMDVIVMIRHPAAFVGSIKKAKTKNWRFDYNNFLNQPLLMKKYLSSFTDQIEKYAQNPPENRVEHGIFLYQIFSHIIKEYREQHQDWMFLRHEDLSLDPCNRFQKVYERLGLNYSAKINRTIQNYSYSKMETDNKINLMEIKRNSFSNIYSWQNRLTKEEIEKVKLETIDVARYFYSDDDLQLK